MRIEVVAGVGQGLTELGAFDAAEMKAGLANCNLIRLSSIVPPAAEVVVVDGAITTNPDWGDKVYCVYACRSTSQPDESVWAGVGWVMMGEEKLGMFAEHDGSSQESVEQQLRKSLSSFMKLRGFEPDEKIMHMKVVGTTCRDQPVCATVFAVYQAEGWQT